MNTQHLPPANLTIYNLQSTIYSYYSPTTLQLPPPPPPPPSTYLGIQLFLPKPSHVRSSIHPSNHLIPSHPITSQFNPIHSNPIHSYPVLSDPSPRPCGLFYKPQVIGVHFLLLHHNTYKPPPPPTTTTNPFCFFFCFRPR